MKRAESISSDRESKRVRISEEKPDARLTHLQKNDALSEQERSESWWTQSEYAEAKDSVKDACREHRRARKYSDCLSNAYQTACDMASSAVEEDTSHQQQQESPDAKLAAPEVPPPDEVSFKLGKITYQTTCIIHYDFCQSFSFYRLRLDRVYFVGLRTKVPEGWKGTLVDFTEYAVSSTCRIQRTLSFWNRHARVYPTNVMTKNWLDKPS
jgi:hypothetical protein